jgi:hypothetical protein
MRYQAFVRAAATVLSTALLAGTAFAQAGRTMTDTAPAPATDRNSVGAVIIMDQPVLAQREQMLQAQERYNLDTRSMGGPARVIREHDARKSVKDERAKDAAGRSRGTPD